MTNIMFLLIITAAWLAALLAAGALATLFETIEREIKSKQNFAKIKHDYK